ncbi:hypothetical protein I5449_01550 [Citrobacter sp. FDAARGOS_156]|uniref:hypothetical protein n=1 Tax=Citrobacter sp. FDAARGOS_156 TaxID=1702170 RepID=UPI0018FF424B|nr:hypothetical protein [Citrobacter sp. FDAARGOS_156]MBJ9110073.1 hypothetical protein [Citrobacter sp. FDAARGOS_156]
MTALNKQALCKELLNPAIGSNHHLRKLALALLDELDKKTREASVNWEAATSLVVECEGLKEQIAELESRTVKLPDVEKWRSFDAVRAQSAYKVLVAKELAAAGITLQEGE